MGLFQYLYVFFKGNKVSPLPDRPILGSLNSAANKDTISKI